MRFNTLIILLFVAGLMFASTPLIAQDKPGSPDSSSQQDAFVNFKAPDMAVVFDQRLQDVVELGRSGKVKEGYDLARQIKSQISEDIYFSFRFMETMVELAEQEGTDCDVKILNEAIKTANKIYKSTCCNGADNPEVAFNFMVSLGKLGTAVEEHRPKTSAQLYRAEGKIAQNLLNSNAEVDEEAKLALAFYHKAVSHAINEQPQEAYAAVQTALENGFNRYDMILENANLRRLSNFKAISTLTSKMKSSASSKVTKPADPLAGWARSELDRFQGFEFNFNVSEVSGGIVTKSNYRGQVVIIDLWATWCAPCRQMIPHMIELQNKYGDQDFQVVGLSMDQPDNPEMARPIVRQFMQDNHFNYPSGLCGNGIREQIPGKLLLPTMLFLDKQGRVRYFATGLAPQDRVQAIIEQLLLED